MWTWRICLPIHQWMDSMMGLPSFSSCGGANILFPLFLSYPQPPYLWTGRKSGETISVHIQFVSIFQNHGKTVMSGPTIITPHIERQIRVLQIERCVPRLFFNHTPKKTIISHTKKRLKPLWDGFKYISLLQKAK